MEERFSARLFDGVSAVPSRGVAWVFAERVGFRGADGAAVEWPVEELGAVHRIAGELHLELGERVADAPRFRLVVEDAGFERRLDELRTAFDPRLGAGASRVARRLGWRTWLVVAVVVLPLAYLGYSVALPHAHVLISREAEAALGEQVYRALRGDAAELDDPRFAALTAAMTAELADPELGFDLRVTLIDADELNAVALPGGRIVVYRGLLRECPSASALAGVLAHEIVHVEHRHGLKHLLRTLGLLYFAGAVVGGGIEGFETAEGAVELSSGLLVLRHSREQESEADRVAVDKLLRAGRDPRGLLEFFAVMRRMMPEGRIAEQLAWVSTHPLTSERIEALARVLPDGVQSRPWIAAEEWQAIRDDLCR